MPMSPPDTPLGPSDVIRLYMAFNRRLTQIVRATTGGRRPLVEDACQVAWTALICPGQRVEQRSAQGWLVRTAVREARRLMRLEVREASLEHAFEQQPDHLRSQPDGEPAELVWRRDQMQIVRLLTARQQRLVWLRALGFSYGEMAAYESATARTIRRQLEQARRRLRTLDDAGRVERAAA